MANILLCIPMADKQTGQYLHNSLIQMGHRVAFFDWRAILEQKGQKFLNEQFVAAVEKLTPDITIICKGIGLLPEAITEAKKRNNDKPIVNWIFDVTLGGTYVQDVPQYVDLLKACDAFYTIDKDALPELEKLGVNARWLTEGCSLKEHGETVFNSIQKRKYGSDVVFLGSVGMIHPNREKFLKRIHEEGFNLKIYGEVYYDKDKEPEWVKDCHTGFSAINEQHSMICQASKIVIGIDGWPHRSQSMSARVYRTLCPGGFLLTTYTKDMENMFTLGEHLDAFKDEEELIEKIIYWLSNDDKREEVAKAGQKYVVEKYQFKNCLNKLLEDFNI